jgi:two-component system, sporulation sensor kinase B
MWIKQVNDLPLYRRILLFSFFMTLVVVVATAGFTFFYQTKQLTYQLTEQAKGIASLWSVTIPPEDVKAVSETRDINDPAMKRLICLVNLIHERNEDYLQGYLIDVKRNHNNEIGLLAVNKTYEEMGIHSFSTYKASKEYIESYSQAVQNKKETTSEIFRDQYGIWLTAFQPIIDEKGNVVAVLGVEVDASILDEFQRKIGLFLIYTLLIITLLVYLTLRWGLRKVLEPVQEIISGINAVSSGDFDVKVRVSKQSEMVQLGEKFNYMTS